ncbi:ribose-phosphate diphosphokinase [Legionella jamestowniensis]|uniref:ribose-phosphate diphosphokinase n=1 Tax=Legionella jamestowniensis TaxID=455 RepID=A0A0W0UTX4_9GAMM|nr:ribose-phosphate pyrophosphokinase [Legionella jamestowniensis]KTD11320.1 ribose-phosphate pyrophosphokinase [Legionella jamestowniensis]OCH98819.1 ribose-phosphate pyrophosphokinase [Legionella jamestowniensis]SFL69134.1 ribose-phosphate pyrophosphokinase [Legionella jamestowniensis DSM 19215]
MEIKLFALNTSLDWGQKIAAHLALPLSTHEEIEFADGEHKIRSLENVRGRDVFLIQSLFDEDQQSVHDKLCRLLFFIGSLKDASAQQVTTVIPYFAFARKDRKTQARDPVTLRYVAQLLEAIGTDRILTLDIHNLAALQNAFRIPTEHLEAHVLFAPYLATLIKDEEVTIVSPDTGGLKRAEQLRSTLSNLLHREIGKAFIDKKRDLEVVTSSQEIIGELKKGVVIIVDDMISSGTTIKLAAEILHKNGAQRIIVCATHGIFVKDANKILSLPYLEKIIITNSIPPFRVQQQLLNKKVVVLDATTLFAQAIKAIHENGSINALLHLTS